MKNYIFTFFLIVLNQALNAQDFTTSLAAFYPFNGNANDAIGTLNGTLVGNTALTTDRFGVSNKAYTFDGAGDWISFSAPPTTVIDNWTVTAWVSPANLTHMGMAVNVGFNDCNGVPSCGYGFGIGDGSGGVGNIGGGSVVQGAFGAVVWLPSGLSYSDPNVWHHVVMVRQAGTTRFYLNGVQGTITSTATPLTPTGLIIGAEEGVGGTGCRFWNGKIDQVRVYNRALSVADVTALYDFEKVPTIVVPPAVYGTQFHNNVLLNGLNDQINCGNLGTMPNQGTISYWINFSTKTGLPNVFTSSMGGNNCFRFEMCVSDPTCPVGGIFSIVIGNGSSLIGGVYSSMTDINIGQWYHIAFTWDVTASKFQGYLDGVEKFNISNSIWPTSNFNNIVIGAGYGLDRRVSAKMDEVRIWNMAQTQSQIIANMNTELVGNEVGLIAYWDMNISGQGAGLTVPNKVTVTGSAIDGHTVGTATTPIFSMDAPLVIKSTQSGNWHNGATWVGGIVPTSIQNAEIQSGHSVTILNQEQITDVTLKSGATLNLNFTPAMFGFPTGGALAVSGTMLVENGATFNMNTTGFTGALSGVINNHGTLTLGENASVDASNCTINNKTDGVFYLNSPTGAASMLQPSLSNATINNEGLMEMRGGANLTKASPLPVQLNNMATGTFIVKSTLRLQSIDFQQLGTLKGNGIVNVVAAPPTTNLGIIAPGNSPGLLQINGDFVNSSQINIEIGGTTVETEYDQLTVVGAATLGGTLNVSLVGGFIPAVANSFTIVDAVSSTGVFSTVNLPTLPTDRAWQVVYNDAEGTVTLNVLAVVLPIEWGDFKATPKSDIVVLDWQTKTEIHAAHFDIERSEDGQFFEEIGLIKAENKAFNYNFIDEHPLSNLSYYRLKQVDLDNKYTFSKTVSVVFGKTKRLKIYPNPSQNDFTIDLPTTEKDVLIEVFDVTGKRIFSKNTEGVQNLKLNANTWKSGVYILKISSQNNIWTEKIMKL